MALYEVLYSWHSENAEDLPLKAGATVMVLEKKEHGWWKGMSTTNPPRVGFFPKSYVRPQNANDQTEEEKKAQVRFSAALKFNQQIHRREFSLNTIEAFDALVETGVAVEMKVESGSNQKVPENSRVTIQCLAMIWDGANIETQVFSDGVLSFSLGKGQVTAGLEEGIVSLSVNDEADIILAPLMAYGDAGQPPIVPPNAHIVYTVKVISVSTSPSDVEKPAEGDAILFSTGISQRINKAGTSAISKKAGAVVLVTDETKSNGNKETEITDEMLAKATEQMGMGK